MTNKNNNNDLISRSKAIEELNFLKYIGYDNSGVMKLQNMEIQRCISAIEDIPAIEPRIEYGTDGQPYILFMSGAQKEDCGKWIFHEDFNDSIKYGCNQCGNLTNIPSNFCPNCGKRMKKYLTGAQHEKET